MAAVIVLLYHVGIKTNHMVPLGYLAVDLFFALSGFVIASNYELSVSNKTISLPQFIRMRLVRLYPLYFLGLLLGLFKELAKHSSVDALQIKGRLLVTFILGVLLTPSPSSHEQLFPLNPPSWSLFQELLINIVFAIVLVRKSNWTLFLVAASALAFLALTISAPYYLDLGWNGPTFLGGFARTIVSFPLGIIICRISYRWGRKTSWLSLLPIACMIFMLSTPIFLSSRSLLELVYVSIGFPVILTASVFLEPPALLISTFAFLGDISYPLYILHSSFSFVYFSLAARAPAYEVMIEFSFVGALLVIAGAVAHYYDRPVRGWLNQIFGSRFSAPEQVL